MFLSETLQKIMFQTYKNWECLIIDDGSSDNTKEVVESFVKIDSRFKYLYQNNSGVSSARSNGFQHASGKYIQFLDADDYIASKKLENQIKILDNNENIDIIYGSVRYFDNNKPDEMRQSLDYSLNSWMPNVSGKGVDIINVLLNDNIMVIQAPLIRKKSLNKIDFTNNYLRHNEDWYLWIKCALSGMNFIYNDDIDTFSYVRVHSSSASQNRLNMLKGELEMRLLVQNEIMETNLYEAKNINLNKIGLIYQQIGWKIFDEEGFFNSLKFFWRSSKITGNYLVNVKYVIGLIKKLLVK